jgi:hypothetical protein
MTALRYIFVSALASPLFAQCSMCYQNAAASSPQGIRALNLGILLLIVPVASIIAGISVVTYRHRGSDGESNPAPASASRSLLGDQQEPW